MWEELRIGQKLISVKLMHNLNYKSSLALEKLTKTTRYNYSKGNLLWALLIKTFNLTFNRDRNLKLAIE